MTEVVYEERAKGYPPVEAPWAELMRRLGKGKAGAHGAHKAQ